MRLIDADELINVILKDHKLDGINANWEINRILVHIKKAPTVEQECYITGAQWDEFMKELKRPHGERAERALAIIDRLRTDGHINNKEQGTLRRAILLPERPQGKWIKEEDTGLIGCSHCHIVWLRGTTAFCPNCGADMRGDKQ